jgi:hypothetical protein
MAKKKQQTSTEESVSNQDAGPIIKTIIKDSFTHPLEKLFKGAPEKCPALKSVGYGQLEEGGSWVSYIITFKRKTESYRLKSPNLISAALPKT